MLSMPSRCATRGVLDPCDALYCVAAFGLPCRAVPCLPQGGDLRQALTDDADGKFAWARHGKQVAVDVARGLHFLHASGVEHGYAPCHACRRIYQPSTALGSVSASSS